MSWKERRLISILGAILGVLVIALLIVLGIRFRKNRDIADASSSSAVTALGVTVIPSFSRHMAHTAWAIRALVPSFT